jgi:proprotein convertase subtilisin/kexin type 5
LPNFKNSCESSTYFDETTNECKPCDVTCLECTGPYLDNCIKCPNKRPYLQSNKCVRSCSEGYYSNETALRCFQCNSNCEKCEHNSANCLSCKQGYTLKDNSCSMIIQYGNFYILTYHGHIY